MVRHGVDPSGLPLVTVVSPSLNQGRYVEHAIRSVLEQDYPRIEYIVVDGGSTDATLDVLRAFGERLRWVSEPDAGQSAAINKGLRMGSGEILAWLNCDDAYLPGAVGRVVDRFLERGEVMLVYGEARFVDEAGRDLGRCDQVEPFDLDRLVHWGDIVAQPAAFFRRRAFEEVGGLDESLQWTMDYDLWIRIGRLYPVLHVPEALALYRLTGANKTASGGRARLDEVAAIGRRHGAGGLPAAFRIERLAAAGREAPERARRHGALAAGIELVGGLGSVLASPRACRGLLGLTARRLSRGRLGERRRPS